MWAAVFDVVTDGFIIALSMPWHVYVRTYQWQACQPQLLVCARKKVDLFNNTSDTFPLTNWLVSHVTLCPASRPVRLTNSWHTCESLTHSVVYCVWINVVFTTKRMTKVFTRKLQMRKRYYISASPENLSV